MSLFTFFSLGNAFTVAGIRRETRKIKNKAIFLLPPILSSGRIEHENKLKKVLGDKENLPYTIYHHPEL